MLNFLSKYWAPVWLTLYIALFGLYGAYNHGLQVGVMFFLIVWIPAVLGLKAGKQLCLEGK